MINPIIELYEYQINNYNNTRGEDYVYKFGEFTDASDNSCGRISVDMDINNNNINNIVDTNLSSCDPLQTLFGGDKYSTYYLDNLYSNYQNFMSKDVIDNVINNNSFDDLMDNIKEAYNTQKIRINNIINNDDDLNKLIKDNNNKSILIRLDVNKNNKIILIGDMHGSFHTFFRLLCRLHKYDIINLETFEIKDPYIIIFLGDILDRGYYSLDIINVIFRLIKINNKDKYKVIYNRGNHESYSLFSSIDNGSLEEFKEKIGDNNKFDLFIKQYLKLLNILPTAVIIKLSDNNQDKYIWCCHGGFPKRFINGGLDLTKDILFFENVDTTDIKWSDFGADTQNNYAQSSRGENIAKYSYNGTEHFLNNNNIDFIIRGHQDSYGNSFIIDISGNFNVISKQQVNIDNFLYYNKTQKYYDYRVNGSIARILVNKNNNYYRVLTISTNTDNRRYLTSDSFALLRFDIDYNNINNFNNCLTSIKQIKELLINNTNINISDILLENLELIKEILTLIKKIKDNQNDSINIIYNDCIEHFNYYNTKYENLKQKLDNYLYINKIKEIQKNKIIKYIYNYKLIIDAIDNLLNTPNINDVNLSKDKLFNQITEKYKELIKYDDKIR